MSQEEMVSCTWSKVDDLIYFCVETGKYHFVCETEMFDETPYDSLSACRAGLVLYAEQL